MDPPSRSKGTPQDAETLLQMEQLFSEAIINSMPGMIYLYNEQRRFLRWNRTFETVSEYSAEEIAEMHPLDFFGHHEKDLIDRKIEEAFAAGDATVEAGFTTKSGRSIPFFLTGRRILFNGKPCVIGMGIDISVRRLTEEALRESEVLRLHRGGDRRPARDGHDRAGSGKRQPGPAHTNGAHPG
jgi:PAS domain S-box-containing protein